MGCSVFRKLRVSSLVLKLVLTGFTAFLSSHDDTDCKFPTIFSTCGIVYATKIIRVARALNSSIMRLMVSLGVLPTSWLSSVFMRHRRFF